ncbi:MAG: hypothetical protein ACPGJS_05475 [Flammeovirgaceae bacterium]
MPSFSTNIEVIIIPRATKQAISFRNVKSFSTYSTWKTLEDTAEVVLLKAEEVIAKKISPGDLISISCGYEPRLDLEFVGYITEVSPNYPFKLTCMDKMWFLDQFKYQFPYNTASENDGNTSCKVQSITLKSLIEDIVTVKDEKGNVLIKDNILFDEEYPWDHIFLRDYRIENMSRKEALAKLKKDFCLTFYYNFDKQLYAGFAYGEYIKDTAKRKNKDTLENFPKQGITVDNVVSKGEFKMDLANSCTPDTNIYQKNLNANNVGVYMSSYNKYLPDQQHHNVVVGAQNPSDKIIEKKTYHVIGDSIDIIENVLIDLGAECLSHERYEGLGGSITSWGWPLIRHSKIMEIKFDNKKELEGRYFVESVETKLSASSGYRRVITLGRKASAPKVQELKATSQRYSSEIAKLVNG